MKRAYIAGKLNDTDAIKYLYNVHVMMDCAEKVRKKGYSVFVPCLDLMMGIMHGYTDYHTYAKNNIEWVKVCDVVFVCPNSGDSRGTKKEIELAKSLGIRIEFL